MRTPTLPLAALLLLLSAPAAFAQTPPPDTNAENGDAFGGAVATGDFNGDGRDDLAIGVPDEDVRVGLSGNVVDAGAVEVHYGSASGLSTRQLWHQNTANVEDAAEAADGFGSALAVGDFNGDGFDDLAIGVKHENHEPSGDAIANSGGVNVIHGSPSGLSATAVPDQFWRQGLNSLDESPETDDEFGAAISAGDFNGDGKDDLAIGAHFEKFGVVDAIGVTHVIYGASGGLSATAKADQLWQQGVGGVDDSGEEYDEFGSALAAGDFNGDGRDDLAIGAEGEWIDSYPFAGAVNVIYGAASGLSTTAKADQFWRQGAAGVNDNREDFDRFGSALAAGDFNGDGRADLAVGVEGEGVNGHPLAGAVNVIYGSASGLNTSTVADQFWHQDGTPNVEGSVEGGDAFGASLAAGDFDNDGRTDLAIGVHLDSILGISDAGAVNVIYGSSAGLNEVTIPDQLWAQDTQHVEEDGAAGDRFGVAVAAGDFNGDLVVDLAIGAAGEDLDASGGAIADAGAIHVLFGRPSNSFSSGGLSAVSIQDQLRTQTYTLPPCCGVTSGPAAEASAGTHPEDLALGAGYPNPFAAATILRYALPEATHVRLAVYDALGREVAVLVDETREAGRHEAVFEAQDLPSGVYLVRLRAGEVVQTQRLTRVD